MEWRNMFTGLSWLGVLSGLLRAAPTCSTPSHLRRWFNVARLIDEPTSRCRRRPVAQALLLGAYEGGATTDDDIYDALFHTRLLDEFTRRRQATISSCAIPASLSLADRLRDRTAEVNAPEATWPPRPAPLPTTWPA